MEHLGPEPFDKAFAELSLGSVFSSSLSCKIRIVGSTYCGGHRNIYADEILFDAGINPFRSCHTLTLKECESICSSASAVLKASD